MPRPLLLETCIAFAAFVAATVCSAQTVHPPVTTGTEPTAVAVNPITNKIYVANRLSDTVTEVDGATHSTVNLPVGRGPQFIAVNPATNKVYVNNATDSSLSVIDGATRVVTTYAIGSWGPISINPVTNKVYIVRLGNADEATIFDGATHSWYSIALFSYSPVAAVINPVTNTLYVATYATGDVRAVDASSTSDHPPSVGIQLWGKPKHLALNPATNRVYVATDHEPGPLAIIDGAANTAEVLQPGTGHGVGGARGIAVNPATNKIYAAFASEVIVIDGATKALTFIPTAGIPVGVGLNALTNKIYVPNSNGSLTVIDGDTNAATTLAIPSGATSIGVNPVTNTMYVANGSGLSPIDGHAADTVHAIPLTTTITPLPGNTGGPSPTFTLNASSTFSPTAPPVRGVYYQLDGVDDGWTAATGSGPYTASFTGLSAGSHTLYAFAVDGQHAPSVMSGPQSNPLVGNIASYAFSVAGGTALNAVKSRKVHASAGTFDLPIAASQPVTGAVTVEPRALGSGHKIVFEFSAAISSPGTVTVVDASSNAIGSASANAVGSTVEVTLTGIPDDRRVTVRLDNVNNQGLNVSASLAFLVGDVDSSRSVTASDILRTKGKSGQAASLANFLHDVDASGSVTSADVASTQAGSGLEV